jgi:protease-4
LVDDISSLVEFQEKIKKETNASEFVKINLEKKKVPFLNVKVDTDLDDLLKGYLNR